MITIVVLQQQLPRFFIQGRLRIWVDEETFDGDENVPDAVRRIPIFLKCVDTDFAAGRHVWVEYLCCKPTCVRDVS